MKKLLIAAVVILTLAGCNQVNGVKSSKFIKSCYANGGVPIILKVGDIQTHEGQFCIKKEAVLDYSEDY
ncbi:hypothetical protein VPHD69_0087 [Vibrio phage D69]